MKNKSINEGLFNLAPLSIEEMNSINGGDGFWYSFFNAIGYGARVLYEVGKSAGEYQGSLPPVHKK